MADAARKQQRIDTLERHARSSAESLGIPDAEVTEALERTDYFALLETLVSMRPKAEAYHLRTLTGALEGLLRIKTFAFPPPVRGGKPMPVVFGTGGHRGEIGVGLTLAHVHVIVLALLQGIETMPAEHLQHHFGAGSAGEVKEKGFVIGHDNRLFNPEFSLYAAHLLAERGCRVRYAGRLASPEISRVVPLTGLAGALNFTPSHNPFRYGGVKFSPADGGLAGEDLSGPLAEEANRLLNSLTSDAWPDHDILEGWISAQSEVVERLDVHDPYLEALKTHPVIRLRELAETLRGLPSGERVSFVADPVFGGAVTVYKRLQLLLGEDVLTLINIEEDAYFGGQTTEPNEQTLEQARRELKDLPGRFKVAIRNDPDGDRGLVGDTDNAIKMNQFAALVLRYLIDLGFDGSVVTTFPTSRFGIDYAKGRGKEVFLTPVGFKNFRSYLLEKNAMVAYEESDGITIAGHTLDKDGVLAGLLAVRIVLHYQKSLSTLLREIETEGGKYYYEQINFEVNLSAAEVRQKLSALKSVKPGDLLGEGGLQRKVKAINTDDGYMFQFEDDTWILMRPSGTEPKVRIYAETRGSESDTEALCALGQSLAMSVIEGT